MEPNLPQPDLVHLHGQIEPDKKPGTLCAGHVDLNWHSGGIKNHQSAHYGQSFLLRTHAGEEIEVILGEDALRPEEKRGTWEELESDPRLEFFHAHAPGPHVKLHMQGFFVRAGEEMALVGLVEESTFLAAAPRSAAPKAPSKVKALLAFTGEGALEALTKHLKEREEAEQRQREAQARRAEYEERAEARRKIRAKVLKVLLWAFGVFWSFVFLWGAALTPPEPRSLFLNASALGILGLVLLCFSTSLVSFSVYTPTFFVGARPFAQERQDYPYITFVLGSILSVLLVSLAIAVVYQSDDLLQFKEGKLPAVAGFGSLVLFLFLLSQRCSSHQVAVIKAFLRAKNSARDGKWGRVEGTIEDLQQDPEGLQLQTRHGRIEILLQGAIYGSAQKEKGSFSRGDRLVVVGRCKENRIAATGPESLYLFRADGSPLWALRLVLYRYRATLGLHLLSIGLVLVIFFRAL